MTGENIVQRHVLTPNQHSFANAMSDKPVGCGLQDILDPGRFGWHRSFIHLLQDDDLINHPLFVDVSRSNVECDIFHVEGARLWFTENKQHRFLHTDPGAMHQAGCHLGHGQTYLGL